MEPELTIDLEKLVKFWGARDWEDFVKTIRSGHHFAVDIRTGNTVKVRSDSASEGTK